MTIIKNTIEQINAALLGYKAVANQSISRKLNITETNNTSEDEIEVELPHFEPSGSNKWGWIRYRKFGCCFGSFSQNLTTWENVPTRVNYPSSTWRTTGYKDYPFSFVKLPTLFFWLKSETNDYTASDRHVPLGPARTELSRVKIYSPTGYENGPSGSYSSITYDIIVVGEIQEEEN